MRVVYSWLKDFVDIDVPVNELADALTSAGLEVASIEQYHIPDGVKVARVIHTEKHPNADRLSVCKVDAGEQEPLTIVCGAPNVRSGMTAALATIEVLERDNVHAHIFALSARLMDGLRAAAQDTGQPLLVQGPGPMFQTGKNCLIFRVKVALVGACGCVI